MMVHLNRMPIVCIPFRRNIYLLIYNPVTVVKERKAESERERNREREREWNKPRPRTPDLYHRHSHTHGSNHSSRSGSPLFNLTNGLGRRGSMTSLKDDIHSVGTSSAGSQAECK